MLAGIFGFPLLNQFTHLLFFLCHLLLHLLYDRWRFFFVLLDHINVALVIFTKLRVDDFLQLLSCLLRYHMLIVVLVEKFVTLKLCDDSLRVEVIRIRCQWHLWREIHRRTLPWFVIGN